MIFNTHSCAFPLVTTYQTKRVWYKSFFTRAQILLGKGIVLKRRIRRLLNKIQGRRIDPSFSQSKWRQIIRGGSFPQSERRQIVGPFQKESPAFLRLFPPSPIRRTVVSPEIEPSSYVWLYDNRCNSSLKVKPSRRLFLFRFVGL